MNMSLDLIEISLIVILIFQFQNFYMILKMNNRLNLLIEKIEQHQRSVEEVLSSIDKSLVKSNEYLLAIAKQNGYY